MTSAQQADPPVDVDAGARLAELGYRQQLHRVLGPVGHVALSVSVIGPTVSLLTVGTVMIATAGTGAIWAYVIGGVLALNIAFCMAELGTMYPLAGGLYPVVSKVLGRGFGFVALVDYLLQGLVVPAAVALGVGTYVNSLFPSISVSVASGVGMIVITLVAFLQIKLNALFLGVLLAIEFIFCLALSCAGLFHLHQHLNILTNLVMPGHGGGLTTVSAALVISALATALYSFNGYDSAVSFSEEMKGSESGVGRAVLRTCGIGVIFQVVPFVLVVFGAASLKIFVSSPTPLLYVARSSFGGTFVTFLTWAALIAIFNTGVAVMLQYSRVYWSTARDRSWPDVISRPLSRIAPRLGTPWVAVAILGIVGTILAFQSTLVDTITFLGVLVAVIYGLVALAAIVSRIRSPKAARPYRLPLWPVPPILALAGVILALTQQKGSDLAICGGVFIAGMIYYLLYLRNKSDRLSHLGAETVAADQLSG